MDVRLAIFKDVHNAGLNEGNRSVSLVRAKRQERTSEGVDVFLLM